MKLPGPVWRPVVKHTPKALPLARKLMEAAAVQGATLEELRNAAKIAVAAYECAMDPALCSTREFLGEGLDALSELDERS